MIQVYNLPLSPSISLYLPISPAISRYLPLSPSISLYLPLSPSISLYLPLSPSISLYLPLSPSISRYLPLSPSISLLRSLFYSLSSSPSSVCSSSSRSHSSSPPTFRYPPELLPSHPRLRLPFPFPRLQGVSNSIVDLVEHSAIGVSSGVITFVCSVARLAINSGVEFISAELQVMDRGIRECQ